MTQKTSIYPSERAIAPAKLSPRELEILRLVADGQSNPEIAATLYLSLGTVKIHVRNILSKFGVEHRLQAAVFALRQGMI
jgi:DNA-binding NarL/FixJ family response regulator